MTEQASPVRTVNATGLRVSTPQTRADDTQAAGHARATSTKSILVTPTEAEWTPIKVQLSLNAERLKRNSRAPVSEAYTKGKAAEEREWIRSIRGTHHTGPFVRF